MASRVPKAAPLLPLLALLIAPPQTQATQLQLHLSCSGTVLEARGMASLKRPVARLRIRLALEAEAESSRAALALLQQRLDGVRQALKALKVDDLRVTSPNVWPQAPVGSRAAQAQVSLQVSATLAPSQLQLLISQVGGLPGVRLAPVDPEADSASEARSNRQLLQAAYNDALERARILASVLGLSQLRPLQLQTEGGSRPAPMAAMALARSTPAPFDPRELPEPEDQLSLEVSFCATP